MKAYLMFEGRDFDFGAGLPPNADDLVQDLELETLLTAMAGGDKFLYSVAAHALFSSLEYPEEIIYRQHVLDDCIAHPEIVREMYAIVVEAITCERKLYRYSMSGVSGVLHRAVEALELFVELLKRLRQIAADHGDEFRSEGLRALFAMLKANLDGHYFATIDEHLNRLRFKDGMLISAELGRGNKGTSYVLHESLNMRKSWKERIGIGPRTSYTFEIHPRDDAGHAALTELCNRGINLVANALAQSSDHILSFFSMFVAEIGFYVSCLNLHDLLLAKNEPVCMPVPAPSTSTVLSFKGIYDVCLALRTERRVVGNEANADEMSLVMITGANSGGKSTLLRSIGLAQLMMQCGMFVSAEALRANVGAGLFTHFIREEDDSMTSGKLDEELARMSMIADQIAPRCMVLFNESFAATNEREGSEIARQIISALLEAGVKVLVVTHQFTLASAFYAQKLDTALFLRAERAVDGRRSFKLVEGEPLPTSFSVDLYRRVGGFEKVAVANTASVDGLGAIEVGTSEADST